MYLPEIVRPFLSRPAALLGMVCIPIGIVCGLLAIVNPLYFAAAFVAIAVTVCFFTHFEKTVIFMLAIRSSLDVLPGLPAAFAIGLDVLVLAHITVLFLTKQKIISTSFG